MAQAAHKDLAELGALEVRAPLQTLRHSDSRCSSARHAWSRRKRPGAPGVIGRRVDSKCQLRPEAFIFCPEGLASSDRTKGTGLRVKGRDKEEQRSRERECVCVRALMCECLSASKVWAGMGCLQSVVVFAPHNPSIPELLVVWIWEKFGIAGQAQDLMVPKEELAQAWWYLGFVVHAHGGSTDLQYEARRDGAELDLMLKVVVFDAPNVGWTDD